ncbi:rhamnosyltransferase [Providencia rettgeri]
MINKTNSSIASIIVTFNPDIDILIKSVNSISSQTETLFIIDNASKNINDIEKTISEIENIIFIKYENNIGLAEAQNIAINKIIDSKKYSHVILFDQDSIINSDFISNLINDELSLISQGHNVAAIGPSFIDPQTNKCYPATVYKGPFIKKVYLKNTPVEATYIIASGSLISIDILSKVGMMKSELFIDYIDVEWSLRAKSKGFKVFVSPNAIMLHTIGDKRVNILGRTVSIHSPFRRYFLIRNSFFMLRLPYIPFGYKLREMTFNLLRIMIGLIKSDQKTKYIKYTFWGIHDGILKKFGPCKHKF